MEPARLTQLNSTISDSNSRKFKFWSFISMFLLVFVHGYNLEIRYLQPFTIPGEPLNFTTFAEYFLANGIFRFRIPMLFIISGFLYALHDQRPYGQRTRKRLRTLLLPYLIWSALGFGFTWALEMFPWSKAIVISSQIVRLDDHRSLLHDYQWYEMIFRWLILPVPYQLWFIRVLLVYNIAYPAIRWCVTHPVARWVFFSIAGLMWLVTMGFVFFEGEGLLFFSLGVWIQKSNFDIDVPKKWVTPLWWGIAFVLLAAIKTVIAFRVPVNSGTGMALGLMFLHKLVILCGLIFAWFGCNSLVTWFMSRKWFVWMSAFAFMIYALHAPLVAYATSAVFPVVCHVAHYRLLTFLLLPATIVIFAVITGALLRRVWPALYGIVTGGRGLTS